MPALTPCRERTGRSGVGEGLVARLLQPGEPGGRADRDGWQRVVAAEETEPIVGHSGDAPPGHGHPPAVGRWGVGNEQPRQNYPR